MDDGEYIKKLHNLLLRYGAHLKEYRIDRDTIDIHGTEYTAVIGGTTNLQMGIEFTDVRQARLFIDVLLEMEEEFTREEAIRKKHPKIQEVYEEYKILLKLYE